MTHGFMGSDGGATDRGARKDGTARGNRLPDIAPLQKMRGQWEGLRKKTAAGAGLPARADLDPRDIAGMPEHTFLIERITPHLARFRLCGTELHAIMGMDPTGMPFSVLFDPQARPRIAAALAQLFDAPAVLDLKLEAERGLGKPPLAGRMTLLPLTDRQGAVTLALGGLVTAGSLGRHPRRFDVGPVASETLQLPGRQAEPAPEFSEAPGEYRPPPRAAPDKPYLRLVYSRD